MHAVFRVPLRGDARTVQRRGARRATDGPTAASTEAVASAKQARSLVARRGRPPVWPETRDRVGGHAPGTRHPWRIDGDPFCSLLWCGALGASGIHAEAPPPYIGASGPFVEAPPAAMARHRRPHAAGRGDRRRAAALPRHAGSRRSRQTASATKAGTVHPRRIRRHRLIRAVGIEQPEVRPLASGSRVDHPVLPCATFLVFVELVRPIARHTVRGNDLHHEVRWSVEPVGQSPTANGRNGGGRAFASGRAHRRRGRHPRQTRWDSVPPARCGSSAPRHRSPLPCQCRQVCTASEPKQASEAAEPYGSARPRVQPPGTGPGVPPRAGARRGAACARSWWSDPACTMWARWTRRARGRARWRLRSGPAGSAARTCTSRTGSSHRPPTR